MSVNGLSIFQEGEISESACEDEWIPIGDDDDSLVDVEEVDQPMEDNDDTVTTESELSDDDDDDEEDSNSSEDEEDSDSEDDELQIIIFDAINGMIFHGYPGYTIVDFFEYI